MKLFKEYLTESKKTYEFRVKIANTEMDADALTKLETALGEFELSSISKAKRLPIQDHPRDFPSMGPCEVSMFEIVLDYPANDEQVRHAITARAGIPLANILVIPRNAPELLMRDAEFDVPESEKKEAILTQDLPKDKGEVPYGDEYNKKMLKALPTRKFDFAKYGDSKVETTNDLAVGTKAPLGSHKPVLPKAKKIRK